MSDHLPVPYDALPDLFEDDLRYHAQRVTACGEPVAAVVLYAVADALAAARTRREEPRPASPNSWVLAAFENEQARARAAREEADALRDTLEVTARLLTEIQDTLAPLIEGDTPQ